MTGTSKYKINWKQDWDEDVGLWFQPSGHTRPVAHLKRVHSAPKAANRLLLAAQTGQVKRVDASRVLDRLRRMQTRDGSSLHGCLRWYWQEKRPTDTNAAFFTGLPLLVLWLAHRSGLSRKQQNRLFSIFTDLYIWFKHAASEGSWYYPNKSLGDIVCGWLLYEICSKKDDRLRKDADPLSQLMLNAAEYWLKHGWGWGEHLSDGYSKVCLDELSALLLLSEQLPERVRVAFKRLLDDLLAVEDAYNGGPRVPALRSYAFLSIPEHLNYRDTIKPLPVKIDAGQNPSLGHTFYHLQWQQLAPPRQPAKKEVEFDCFDNVVARAHIEKDIRAGSVSRFPLMPSIEFFTHGLSWQSMPAALARPGKTWIFLQWETRECGRTRCHPAENKKTTYLGNGLTEAVHPPIVGQTWSLQEGGMMVVLRIMPRISTSWRYLTDRVRVVGEAGSIRTLPADGYWNQLLLRWRKRELSIHCIPLISANRDALTAPVLKAGPKGMDWNATYSKQALHDKRLIVTLWAFYLDGKIDSAPAINPVRAQPVIPRTAEESAWKVEWGWPHKMWRLVIDPLSSHPLQEV